MNENQHLEKNTWWIESFSHISALQLTCIFPFSGCKCIPMRPPWSSTVSFSCPSVYMRLPVPLYLDYDQHIKTEHRDMMFSQQIPVSKAVGKKMQYWWPCGDLLPSLFCITCYLEIISQLNIFTVTYSHEGCNLTWDDFMQEQPCTV